jgi:arylsulfatase A-like enzyme
MLAAVLGWGCGPADEAESPSEAIPAGRPDIVVVVMEGLRWDRVGAYGHTQPTTPQLDALAARGRRFERAYAHSSWSLPSLGTLLTGARPHEHGAGRSPSDPSVFGSLGFERRTLPESVANVGYRAAAIVSGPYLAPRFGLDRGFAVYDHQLARRDGTETVREGLEWLDRSEQPAFLLLHLAREPIPEAPEPPGAGSFAAQRPLPSGETLSASDIADWHAGLGAPSRGQLGHWLARYDDATRTVDHAIERLLRGLEDQGRLERTLVVVTSDHGEEFGEHGGYGHGHAFYGAVTRVPLVVAGPGIAPGVIGDLVSHVDLYWGLQTIAGSDGIQSSSECGPLDPFVLDPAAEPTAGRLFVMGNLLRGAPRMGGTTRLNHLELHFEGRRVELWNLDETGREAQPAPTGEGRGEFLLKRLAKCRGGMGMYEPSQTVAAPAAE